MIFSQTSERHQYSLTLMLYNSDFFLIKTKKSKMIGAKGILTFIKQF